jgi:hypothetical protein
VISINQFSLINKVYSDRPENNLIIARSDRHRLLKDGYFLICIINAGKVPPDPAFVAQVEGQNGMLDAVDDSYLVLCGKGGKEHEHLHECELFEPHAPVPRSMTALQKEVLAGNWRTPSPVKDFFQKSTK